MDPSVGIGIETGETTTVETIIGPTIGIGVETTVDMTIGEITIGLMKDGIPVGKTIGQTITDMTIETDKIIEEMTPNRGIGIGVRVEIDQEIIVATILGVEIEIEIDGCNKEPELCQMTETDLGLGLTQE